MSDHKANILSFNSQIERLFAEAATLFRAVLGNHRILKLFYWLWPGHAQTRPHPLVPPALAPAVQGPGDLPPHLRLPPSWPAHGLAGAGSARPRHRQQPRHHQPHGRHHLQLTVLVDILFWTLGMLLAVHIYKVDYTEWVPEGLKSHSKVLLYCKLIVTL